MVKPVWCRFVAQKALGLVGVLVPNYLTIPYLPWTPSFLPSRHKWCIKHSKCGISGGCSQACAVSFQWRHNECDGVSNHRCLDSLLNGSLAQIKENTKAPRHWPLWGESTGGFPTQRTSNAENISISWRHHGYGSVSLDYTEQYLSTWLMQLLVTASVIGSYSSPVSSKKESNLRQVVRQNRLYYIVYFAPICCNFGIPLPINSRFLGCLLACQEIRIASHAIQSKLFAL